MLAGLLVVVPVGDAFAHHGHTGPPDESGNYAYCAVNTTHPIGIAGSPNVWASCTYGPTSAQVDAVVLRLTLGSGGGTSTVQVSLGNACTASICVTNENGSFQAMRLFNDGADDEPWQTAEPASTGAPCLVYFRTLSGGYPCSVWDLDGAARGLPDYPPHSWGTPGTVTYSNGANSSPAVNADGSAIAYVSAANNLTLTPLQGQEVPVDTNLVNDVYVYLNDQVALATFNYATWQSANGPSEDPDITANARYVVFASKATNLVANDSNGSVEDIFRFDTQDGSIALVSLKTNGAAANGHSLAPSISDDGRFVAFVSDSTNLVSGDTNAKRDVFLRDMSTGTTTRLSVSSNGSQATGESNEPVISADGKVVAFHSLATNLIGSDKNKVADVFTRTIATNTTQRVSVTSTGGEGNARSAEATISSDGRYVAFQSSASNLVSGDTNGFLDVFVRDRTGNTTSRMSIPPSGSLTNGASYAPTISADGRFVAFATEARYDMSDTNGVSDVFEYDRTTGRLARRTSPSSDDPSTSPWLNGASTEPAISDNGISLAFVSTATNVISPPKPSATPDIHVHKWKNKRTRCLMFLISLTLAAEISLSRWADLDQDNRCDETAAMGPGDLTADPAATHSTPPLGPDIFQDNEERHSRLRFGTGTWGYNKIRPQHGWDVAVRNQVQMVLLAPSHTDEQGYTQVYYGTYFSSTWSTTCTRKVVIDYGPKPQIGKEPYYIINTYSRIGAWPDGGF